MENKQKPVLIEVNFDQHIKNFNKHQLSKVFESVEKWSKADRNDPKKIEETVQKLNDLGFKKCPHTALEIVLALG